MHWWHCQEHLETNWFFGLPSFCHLWHLFCSASNFRPNRLNLVGLLCTSYQLHLLTQILGRVWTTNGILTNLCSFWSSQLLCFCFRRWDRPSALQVFLPLFGGCLSRILLFMGTTSAIVFVLGLPTDRGFLRCKSREKNSEVKIIFMRCRWWPLAHAQNIEGWSPAGSSYQVLQP